MSKEISIVTAVTPDYLDKFRWSFYSWQRKPQFQNVPIIIFHHGFDAIEPKELQYIKDYYDNWTFVKWDMSKYDNQRELMLSSFILGVDYVKTPYYVKIDADTCFTNTADVFGGDDFDYDIVSHKWHYTKPGWWIDAIDAWLDGKKYEGEKKPGTKKDKRIQSICCLHKTSFVDELKNKCGQRLPVPSHDTLVWYYAEKTGRKWKGKNLKKYGVDHTPRWKTIREVVCATPQINDYGLGKQLLKNVQIEITSNCNLACNNCDRNCKYGFGEDMRIRQINKFVQESIDFNYKFGRIDIIGGEPLFHKKLNDVFEILKIYKNFSPKTKFRLSTNGTSKAMENINIVPDWVKVRNSNKPKKKRLFDAYHDAPIDKGEKAFRACSIPWRCGIGLTKYGYFPCGAGASLAKIFQIDIGVKNLKDYNIEAAYNQMKKLCKYCGHAYYKSKYQTNEETISKSWDNAIKNYKEGVLSVY